MKTVLVIVCGLQGVGKTVVAKKLVKKINGVLLRTDVVRKELFKNSEYTEEEKQKVYKEIFNKAKRLLQEGKDVVLDATFAKKELRIRAEEIAKDFNFDFKVVKVLCEESIVKKRIEKRTNDESEARFKHYLEYKKLFEPIEGNYIIIDNSMGLQNLDEQINKYF